MNFARTYLDYNASAPLLPQARDAMIAAMPYDGNPSSVHAEGRRLRAIIETARDAVAALVGARAADVVFTSGATEANVTALRGGFDTIYLSALEHDSVRAPAQASGARLAEVPVRADGVIDAGAFAAQVLSGADPRRAVVAVQLANNETGVIQPVEAIAAFAHAHGIAVHTDAVQAAGRIGVDFASLGADTMALSAHKIGGPKGVGALVVREGVAIERLMCGGGQERRRRAGTENLIGIAGFGAAAAAALAGLETFAQIARLRDRLEGGLRSVTPDVVVFGAGSPRVANTTTAGVAGKPSDILVIKLDVAGFAVSAGSACSSGKVGGSQLLAAMGTAPDAARGAIRVSIGPQTTQEEIDSFIRAWGAIHPAAGSGSRAPAAVSGTGGRGLAAEPVTGE